MINYDFLINRDLVEVFLNENKERIFGGLEPIEVISVSRSHTYNLEAYNVLLEIKRKNKQFIRVSANASLSKKHDFDIMNFFYQSFKKKPFFCPKPLALLEPESILFYENAVGEKFADSLSNDSADLKDIVGLLGILAKKIHHLPKPNFTLFDSSSLFSNYNIMAIEKEFPELAGKTMNIIEQNKSIIADKYDPVLCHGDFNPNNFLINDDKIFIIDFDLTCLFHPELDLASFLTHLRMMLAQKNRLKIYEQLKKDFLTSYGNFNKIKFYALMLLLDLRLLEISINYSSSGYDKKFLFDCLQKDLVENET